VGGCTGGQDGLIVDDRADFRVLEADGYRIRIDGSALAAQPGKSQGRPQKSPGSKPIAQNGLPNLRSPEGACPSRPNLSRRPDDTGAFTEQFHAARSESRTAVDAEYRVALREGGCLWCQSRSDAVTGIIGARRAWTVSMISALSMPWR
jgi:hypothetical protein